MTTADRLTDDHRMFGLGPNPTTEAIDKAYERLLLASFVSSTDPECGPFF